MPNIRQSAIRAVDLEIKALQTKISVTENKIDRTNLTLDAIQKSIDEHERKIDTGKKAIAETMQVSQSGENEPMIETILREGSFSAVWKTLDTTEQFRTELKQNTDFLTREKAGLETDQTEKLNEKKSLVSLKNELADQQLISQSTKSSKNRLLNETKNKESEYKKLVAEKTAAKEQFEKELFDYESKLKIAIDPASIPDEVAGVLSWPLDSIRVTQYFGKTVDAKRLYASGSHNGVDFAAVVGSKVKAAREGTVIGTGNTDLVPGCASFGKWVMVQHDNGLSTMYAHLSLISVSQGQSVARGELLGYSGATGYATGPHLHFGVYASEGVRIEKYSASINCKTAVMPLAPTKGYLDPMAYLPKL